MKKLLFSFFLICCAVPLTAEAADLFNTNGSFKVAKAVKLGRGSAYSVSASSNVNTGGKISSKKTCSAGCSDCDTSTGWCNACMSRYAKDNAGKCHPCPSNCASCWMEYGTQISCETCDSGYKLASKSVSGSGPFYCEEEACYAGYYRTGSNNCVKCSSGTYSIGSNATSCKACSTLFVGSNTTCTNCTTTGSCTSYLCSAGYYLGSNNSCIKCSSGTYSYGSNATFCKACSTLYVGSNLTCTSCTTTGICTGSNATASCSAGYYLKNGVCTACASGTYSKGGTATSCSSCSTLYTSAGSNTCTSCTTTGTCTGSNSGSGSGSGSNSGSSCYSHSNCPQGYECTGNGCGKCKSGSNLSYGNCNCPSGSVSDGNGNCIPDCSYPYTVRCTNGRRACCRSSSACYSYSTSDCWTY